MSLPWPRAIVRAIVDWSPWIVLTPLVWWLANRFSVFDKAKRWRNVMLHILSSIALVIAAEAMIIYAVAPITHAAVPEGVRNVEDRPKPKGSKRPQPRRRPEVPAEGLSPGFEAGRLALKAQFWFPLYWVLVFLTSSTRHFRESQEREKRALQLERDLATARLTAIQSRLEPHFFFNTLNSISSLIHSNPDKADEMITQLSDLLRQVLARSETQQIRLDEELELLREYLAIQIIRFPRRLQVEEKIDEATLPCFVPTLLLQPLAENAVRHGIEPKPDPSTLLIASRLLDEKQIELIVEDDGLGWENTSATAREVGGFGLANIRSRLDALYPDKNELRMETPSTGGTRIVIRFPASMENP